MTISLKQRTLEVGALGPSSSTAYRNVAVRPTAYDDKQNVTHGVDITTGEQVSIRLDPAKATDSRNDVRVWSMPRFSNRRGYVEMVNRLAVVPGDEGGVIIFESVRSVGAGQPLQASWGTTAAHSQEDAEVFQALVRPAHDYRNKKLLDPKSAIELIRPMSAQTASSMAELRAVMEPIVARPFVKAVVRIQDSFGDVAAQAAYKGERETPAEAVQRFLDRDNVVGRLLNDEVCAGAVVEVIAMERIYPGSDYQKVLRDPAGNADSMIYPRDWTVKGVDGCDAGFGFSESIVALRQWQGPNGESGGWMLTRIRPTTIYPLLYPGYEDFPSPNIRPKAAPVVSQARIAATGQDEPAAQIPAKVTAQPDTPATDERVAPDPDVLAQKLASAARMLRKG